MRRYLAAVGIVGFDSAVLTFAHAGTVRPWLLPVWAAVVAAILALSQRRPALAFLAALLPALVTGGAGTLLPYTAYRAGRGTGSTPAALCSALGVFVVAELFRAPNPTSVIMVSVALGFVPLLVGAYVAQQERQAAALATHERLRIARDMHDALGHRLSLVSMQAAALEVAELPAPHQEAVRRLAEQARSAAGDLHDVIGGLRAPRPGLAAITDLVTRARTAGVPVDLTLGDCRPEPPEEVGAVAFRLVQEGLTNGCKHAPGAPIAVRLEWEDDALLLSVVNPVPPGPVAAPGRGLLGLAERAELAGGLAGHAVVGGEFRLWAVFPATPAARPPAFVGVALAGIMFGLVPLALLVGVAG
ncbi:sensor histidine kinase [Dactylosporangium sp. NPDC051541]|uniref:sensor histidine kinase n=1 Tax=Dactylosporangium sp. NPDC051541 TaxID=3363977 RepID=UPI0037903658